MCEELLHNLHSTHCSINARLTTFFGQRMNIHRTKWRSPKTVFLSWKAVWNILKSVSWKILYSTSLCSSSLHLHQPWRCDGCPPPTETISFSKKNKHRLTDNIIQKTYNFSTSYFSSQPKGSLLLSCLAFFFSCKVPRRWKWSGRPQATLVPLGFSASIWRKKTFFQGGVANDSK